jgi:hypothetical protein
MWADASMLSDPFDSLKKPAIQIGSTSSVPFPAQTRQSAVVIDKTTSPS